MTPRPQAAAQVAGVCHQTAHMIAIRLRDGLGQDRGDEAGTKCPPAECTVSRHREIVYVLLGSCLAMLVQLTDEGTTRAAIAIHACGPTEVRAALAAHRMLSVRPDGWVGYINGLGQGELVLTTTGLVECAAGLALEMFGDTAPADVLDAIENITAEVVEAEVPAYLATRPWAAAPATS